MNQPLRGADGLIEIGRKIVERENAPKAYRVTINLFAWPSERPLKSVQLDMNAHELQEAFNSLMPGEFLEVEPL